MPSYLLGIDIGTTGCKALLINSDGSVVSSSTVEYPLFTSRPLWSEQNPEDWWRATRESIRDVLERSGIDAHQISGIGLTGQMHGLVMLDAHGAVIRPCILWNDQRTMDECVQITKTIGLSRLLELTGNPVLPGFTLPKIIWVRNNEPESYRKTSKVLLPKDYIRYRLTGEFYGEVSDASGTSLFDVRRRRWSGEMLGALSIPSTWMPDVTESTVASSRVSRAAAGSCGLIEGTPVVGGGGDQAAQAVGMGIVNEGTVSVTIGTSGVVFAASAKYRREREGKLHAFCHAIPGMWHLMGVMLSAGGSLRWYRDTLCLEERERAAREHRDAYELLTEAASGVKAGCEGLLFLPYLTGERTPYPDPHARGVFFGLSLRHGKAHMTRAVIEGVTYGLRDSLELMRSLGISVKEIRSSGGGARSTLWRQILADTLQASVALLNVAEGAAYGAALLAGVGAGVFTSVSDACERTVAVTETTRVSKESAIYDEYYPHYRALYASLAPQFKAVAGVVERRSSE
jgi:xylulokinase